MLLSPRLSSVANEHMRALAEYYRSTAAEGCHNCGRSFSPCNRRRGGWCEACEMQESDDGLSRNHAASNDGGGEHQPETPDDSLGFGPSLPRPGGR